MYIIASFKILTLSVTIYLFIYFVEQVYKKLLGDIINMISCILCCTRAVVEATAEVTIDNLIQQEL